MHLSDYTSNIYWEAFKWPNRVLDQISRAKTMLDANKELIICQITADKIQAESTIVSFKAKIHELSNISDLETLLKTSSIQNDMLSELNALKDLSFRVQQREKQMECSKSTFNELADIIASFESYQDLLHLSQDSLELMKNWTSKYFIELDGEKIISIVASWSATIHKLLQAFVHTPKSKAIVEILKTRVDDFCRNTQVITALRNPALQASHWEQISAITGLTLEDFSALCLSQVLDLDLELVQDTIVDISNEASIEYRLESEIEIMRVDLLTKEFCLKPFYSTEYTIINNFQDPLDVLYNQLQQCQVLIKAAIGTGAMPKIEQWVKKIHQAQDLLYIWSEVQAKFTLLYPLMTNKDNFLLLGDRNLEEFTIVSKTMTIFSEIVTKAKKYITLLHRTDLHEIIQGGDTRLRFILGNMDSFLYAKRSLCPRLYLVSDEEVQKTLSCIDTVQLSAAVSKYFDGVDQLLFGSQVKNADIDDQSFHVQLNSPNDQILESVIHEHTSVLPVDPDKVQNTLIIGVMSHHGEKLYFQQPIPFFKNIESVILQIEAELQNSLQHAIQSAWTDLSSATSWISASYLTLPLQATLVALQGKCWEKLALFQHHSEDVSHKEFRLTIISSIDTLVADCRTENSALVRFVCESIIATLISSLNLVEQRSTKQQLIVNPPLIQYQLSDSGKLSLNFTTTPDFKYPYGYEYQGTNARNILSCSMLCTLDNLQSVLSQNQFAALYGKDKSNKLTTILELSHFAGYTCLVINCAILFCHSSFENVYRAFSKTRSWLVLQNVHSTSQKILGLIGEYIRSDKQNLTIQSTLYCDQQSHQSKLHEMIKNPFPAIFATLPSMHFWKHLPNNFRQLFRPTARVLPNSRVIVEALLAAKWYKSSRELASKFEIFTELIPVCFSGGFHCNISCVCRIIRDRLPYCTAQSPFLEANLVVKAIQSIFLPMLSQDEGRTLSELLQDVFGCSVSNRSPQYFESKDETYIEYRKSHLQATSESMGLHVTESVLQKAIQLFDTLAAGNHQVVLVGRSASGKSTCWNLVKNALHSWKQSNLEYPKVFECFPACFPATRLPKHADFKAFKDSILRKTYYRASEFSASNEHILAKDTKHQQNPVVAGYAWIVLDEGDDCDEMDMIYNIFSLEGNTFNQAEPAGKKTLVRIIHKVTQLAAFSPRQITAAPIVFFDGSKLLSEHIVHSTINRAPSFISHLKPLFLHIFHQLIVPAVQFKHAVGIAKQIDTAIERFTVEQVYKLLFALFIEFGIQGLSRLTYHEQCIWTVSSALFSIIWVIGAQRHFSDRIRFDLFVREKLTVGPLKKLEQLMGLSGKLFVNGVAFPSTGTVFDFTFDDKHMCWTPWSLDHSKQREFDCVNPTIWNIDAVRIQRLAGLYLSQNQHVLIDGLSGVGKSHIGLATMSEFVSSSDKYLNDISKYLFTQNMDMECFKKHVEAGLFVKSHNTMGIPSGQKRLLFIDDLNGALLEQDKTVFETLRMLMSTSSWYSNKDIQHIEDVSIVATYRIASEYAELPVRFLRYFSVITLDDNDADRLNDIGMACFTCYSNSQDLLKLCSKFIQATLDLCHRLRLQFPQSMQNPHYIFSMRDMVGIIRNVGMQSKRCTSTIPLLCCWLYSSLRVWSDRLEDAESKTMYDKVVKDVTSIHFAVPFDDVFQVSDDTFLYSRYLLLHDTAANQSDILVSHTPETLVTTIFNLPSIKNDPGLASVRHPHGVIWAIKIACILGIMEQSAALVGNNIGDHCFLAKLSSMILKAEFYSYSISVSNSKTLQISAWNNFLLKILNRASNNMLVIAYIDSSIISQSMWQDVQYILKFGVKSDFVDQILTSTVQSRILEYMRNFKQESSQKYTNEKRQIKEICLDFIKSKIRFVIGEIGNAHNSDWVALASHYPWIPFTFSVMRVQEWDVSTVAYVMHCFFEVENLSVMYNDCDWLSRFFVAVSHIIPTLSQAEYSETRSTPRYSPNTLLNSIRIFASELGKRLQSHMQTIAYTEIAAKKISTIFQHELELHEDKSRLLKSVETLSAQISATLQTIEKTRAEREIQNEELKIQKDGLKKWETELQYLQVVYQSEIEKALLPFEASIDEIKLLERSDIYDLKGIDDPCNGILLIFEAITQILQHQSLPNESEWESARRLISTPSFLSDVLKVDKDDISSLIWYEIERCAKHVDFDSPKVKSQSKAASYFQTWIRCLEKYHKATLIWGPQKRQIHELEDKISKQSQHIREIDTSIVNSDVLLKTCKTSFEKLMRQQEELQRAIKNADNTLLTASTLISSLQKLYTGYQNDLVEKSSLFYQLVIQSLLFACNVTYAGPCSPKIRAWIIQQCQQFLIDINPAIMNFKEIMDKNKFCFVDYISDGRPQDMYLVLGFPPSDDILESALISTHHCQLPLIWDPYHQSQNWIAALNRVSECKSFNAENPNIFDQLMQSIQMGSTCILLLDSVDIPPIIESLIVAMSSRLLFSTAQKSKISWNLQGSRQVSIGSTFSMYLIVRLPKKESLWRNWMRYTAEVQIPIENSHILNLVQETILKVDNPELHTRKTHLQVSSSNRFGLLKTLRSRGVNFCGKLGICDVTGGDIYRSIIDVEQQITTNQKDEETTVEALVQVDKELVWYIEVSQALTSIYLGLQRLRLARPEYTYSVDWFIGICNTQAKLSKKEIKQNPKSFLRMVVDSVCKSASIGLAVQDRTILLFIISKTIADVSYFGAGENGFSETYLRHMIGAPKKIVNVLPGKTCSTLTASNPATDWLDNEKWTDVLQLSTVSNFSRFALDFSSYANRATTPVLESSWEDIGNAVDPISIDFPPPWNTSLTSVEKMLVLKTLRPDILDSILKQYAQLVLGTQIFDEVFPVDPWLRGYHDSAPTVPIIVCAKGNEDPIKPIIKLAFKRRLANPNLVILSISALTSLESSLLEEYVANGRWIVVYTNYCPYDYLSLFSNQISVLLNAQIEKVSSFRLWLVVDQQTVCLTPTKVVRVWYEHNRDYRIYLEEALYAIEDAMSYESKTPTAYRNFLFGLCFFYAKLRSQLNLLHLDICGTMDYQISDLNNSIKLLRRFFAQKAATNDSTALIHDVYQYVCEVAFKYQLPTRWEIRLLHTWFSDTMKQLWTQCEKNGANSPSLVRYFGSTSQKEHDRRYDCLSKLPYGPDPGSAISNLIGGIKCLPILHSDPRVVTSLQKCWPELICVPKKLEWRNDESFPKYLQSILDRVNNVIVGTVFEVQCLKSIKPRKNKPSDNAIPNHSADSTTVLESHKFACTTTGTNSSRKNKIPKFVDAVLHTNVVSYLYLLRVIKQSLTRSIYAFQGRLEMDFKIKTLVQEIYCQHIPTEWILNGYTYASQRTFPDWLDNFFNRLAFINRWYSARYLKLKPGAKELIMYDLSKMFSPKAFIQAILMDTAIVYKEKVEDLDIEVIMMSGKQTAPAERGCYVSGLHLFGASFDFHKNVLCKNQPSKLETALPCVWLQPVSKIAPIKPGKSPNLEVPRPKMAMLRTRQRIGCPVYIYHSKNTLENKDLDDCSKSANTGTPSPEDLYLFYAEFSTEVPVKFWIEKNISIVCEV
ncbi:hypothetical protein BDEG_22814 [Batrachochytrium dendrobatidis JEL423]|nr:hypothetical protein BDEG_22814 [Batrachochytrium dendrobatidis JEL423]